MSGRPKRTAAEWTTFVVSCLVLGLVVALVASQAVGADDPPEPVAEVAAIRAVRGRYFVDVTVTNKGDETASAVQVTADLEVQGESATADQTIDFLAGSETEDLVFVFDEAPSTGKLTVVVSGFAIP